MALLNPFGDRELTREERRLVLRAMAIIAVPLAVITLLVAGVSVALFYNQLRVRTIDNREAIDRANQAAKQAALLAIRLHDQGVAVDRKLAQQVYNECLENENQDAANTALFLKVRALVAQGPPTPQRDDLINGLNDTILAREPPGEKPCVPPKTP